MVVERASRLKAEPTSQKTKESRTSIALKASPPTLDRAAGRVAAKAVEDVLEEEDGGIIVVEDRAVEAGAADVTNRNSITETKETRVSFFFCAVLQVALLCLSAHGSFRRDHHQK